MAQLTSIKMSKFDNQPWGFRLQGGIDFAAPLTVQKVSFHVKFFTSRQVDLLHRAIVTPQKFLISSQ